MLQLYIGVAVFHSALPGTYAQARYTYLKLPLRSLGEIELIDYRLHNCGVSMAIHGGFAVRG